MTVNTSPDEVNDRLAALESALLSLTETDRAASGVRKNRRILPVGRLRVELGYIEDEFDPRGVDVVSVTSPDGATVRFTHDPAPSVLLALVRAWNAELGPTR